MNSARAREQLIERDGDSCAYCGIASSEMEDDVLTLDHKVPRSRGGTNALENLHLLCRACNCSKGTKTDVEAQQSVWLSSGLAAKGYTVAYNSVLFDSTLSPMARILYFQLRHYAWIYTIKPEYGAPLQAEIAANLGVRERALRPYVRELEDAGFVTAKRRGRGLSNVYVVHEPVLNGKTGKKLPVSIPGQDQQPTSPQIGSILPDSPSIEDKKTTEAKASGAVQEIYDHWRAARGKTRANYDTLSDARRKKITSRLKEFSLEQLLLAIDGVANDPWSERHLHDDLTVIFRSQEQVDRFIGFAEQTPAPSRRYGRGVTTAEMLENARRAQEGPDADVDGAGKSLMENLAIGHTKELNP